MRSSDKERSPAGRQMDLRAGHRRPGKARTRSCQSRFPRRLRRSSFFSKRESPAIDVYKGPGCSGRSRLPTVHRICDIMCLPRLVHLRCRPCDLQDPAQESVRARGRGFPPGHSRFSSKSGLKTPMGCAEKRYRKYDSCSAFVRLLGACMYLFRSFDIMTNVSIGSA